MGRLAGLECVDSMVQIYTELIEKTLDIHAPFKDIKQHPGYKSGLSKETKELMKKRDEARKHGYTSYKNLRNRCVSSIRNGTRKATGS